MLSVIFLPPCLIITACQGVTISAQVLIDDNPSFRIMNFYESAEGRFFSKLGNTLSTRTTQNKNECSFKCLQNQDCLSVNVFQLGTSDYQCELLNWTGTALDKYLTNKTHSWFMQRESVCVPNPCKNGSECIANQQRTNFTCNCAYPYFGRDCENICIGKPLGMEDGRIPNNHVTATRTWSGDDEAWKGRLNSNPGHWAPGYYGEIGDYLQVYLGNATIVTGIATQGRPKLHNFEMFVKTYKLAYSNDAKTWSEYTHSKLGQILPGNSNHNETVTNTLHPLIINVRYIRVLPMKWNGQIALRIEFYGCYIISDD